MDNKPLKALYQGEADFGGIKISCANLEDGTRVLVNRSVANIFQIKGSGNYWQKRKEQKGALLPEYLSANYLRPFISEEIVLNFSNPISYINKQGVLTEGIKASLLSDICDIFKKAGEKGALKNPIVGELAYKIILALSKVAIDSIIDEATGYQYEREKDELQKLLRVYISEELLPWQKRFPDIYYKELFRLNGWDFTVNGIQKRPQVIGKWTNTLVYEQLPNGILSELKKKTPKSKAGNRTAQYHRYLTLDVGDPNLTAQINQVVTLFLLSENMEHMWKQFEKLKDRQAGQLDIPFEFDEKGHTIEPEEEKKAPISQFNKNLKKGLEFDPTKDENKDNKN